MKKIIVMLTILLSGMVQSQTFDFNCESDADYINSLLLEGGIDALLQESIDAGLATRLPSTQKGGSSAKVIVPFSPGGGFDGGADWIYTFTVGDKNGVRNLGSGLPAIRYIEFKDACNDDIQNFEGHNLSIWIPYSIGTDFLQEANPEIYGEPGSPYGLLRNYTELNGEVQPREDYVIVGEEYERYNNGLSRDPKNYYGDLETSIDDVFEVNPTEFCSDFIVEDLFSPYTLELTNTETVISGSIDRLVKTYNVVREGYTAAAGLTIRIAQYIPGYTLFPDSPNERDVGGEIYWSSRGSFRGFITSESNFRDNQLLTDNFCGGTVYITHPDGVSIYRDGVRVTGSANQFKFGDPVPQDITHFAHREEGGGDGDPVVYIPCTDIGEYIEPPCELGRVNVGSGYRIFAIGAGGSFTQIYDGDAIPRGTTHYEITEISTGQNLVRYEYTECEDILPPVN